jgi:predicted metal-binding protein
MPKRAKGEATGEKSRLDKYLKLARKMGADDALVIWATDVVLDPRTYLKCMYGCKDWGKNWTCPSAPGAIRPWEFGEIFLRRYRLAILVHSFDKKTSQKISLAIEREAFLDGHYFAFSMSDCSLCESCAHPEPCRNPKQARPAMQGLGIDVYATVRKFGLPLEPLRDATVAQNWYSLVLIE